MIRELTDNTFDEFVRSEKYVVVDFFATWCGPCKMLEPVLEDISEEMQDEMKFGRLDVDANPAITEKFGVMSMPTLLVFEDGNVKERLVGYAPKSALLDRIRTAL